jgi:RimJ/RimL family protein N-acetyltransferase
MLETQRLLLLPWRSEDWLQLKPIAQDPEVMRYISEGQPWTDERIRELVGRQVSGFEERGFCFWRLLRKKKAESQEPGEMIGFCGLQPLGETGEIEIGWWLARACWGKGFATEAAREAMRDGFERVKLDRIVSIALPENRASIHVMQKLGMRFERETTHHGFRVAMYSIERAGHAHSGSGGHGLNL